MLGKSKSNKNKTRKRHLPDFFFHKPKNLTFEVIFKPILWFCKQTQKYFVIIIYCLNFMAISLL